MRLITIALILLAAPLSWGQSLAPLEAYGKLPEFGIMELSPDGTRYATRLMRDGQDLVVVLDSTNGSLVSGANAVEVNPRWLRFIDENHLVLVAGRTVRTFRVRHAFDYSQAYLLEFSSGKVKPLMKNAEDLYPYQSGLGRIVGRDAATNTIFMPAYFGKDYPRGGVYAATPGKRRELLRAKGNADTIDWFLDGNGRTLVREDFDDEKNLHQVWIVNERGRNERLLYEEETELRTLGVSGLTAERDALVVLRSSRSIGGWSYFLMSLEDGSISGPVLTKEGFEIEGLIKDVNQVVYGVEYSGFKPTYAFFDQELNDRVETIQQRLPGMYSRLVSWTDSFDKLLFLVEGDITAGSYLLFERGKDMPTPLGTLRPGIGQDQVVPVEITEYAARDGMTIPALVTVRNDVREKGNAPLIVNPHGGPKAHDLYGFDWFAQYFASRGYVVLQPQYRGSDGFGYEHEVAGDGEYGGKMQTDIDDGALHLIEQGLVDPERVCIVGASYGGYAALYGGAFAPELYKCVAAIAPVTDIPRKMKTIQRRSGRDDSSIDFWEGFYGADTSDKELLRAISPVFHADKFQAPVLLVHGNKDTVVEIVQSQVMEKALKKAKKDVTFVKLKGEDHWLTQEETRIDALRAVAEFIEKHL